MIWSQRATSSHEALRCSYNKVVAATAKYFDSIGRLQAVNPLSIERFNT
jgi:hypothetical protein